MTIKETIEQIKSNLDSSYSKLQELKYEEEIENYVRINLSDTLSITEALLSSVCWEQIKQKRGKNIKRQQGKGG